MGSGGKRRWKFSIFTKNRNENHHEHKQQQQQQPPKEFLCPISGHLMSDPVIVHTGQTFQRCYIQACIDLGVDPPTPCLDDPSPPITSMVFVPNLALRSAIIAWCDSHGVDRPQPMSSQSAISLVRSLTSSSLTSVDDVQNPPLQRGGEEEEEADEEEAREKEDTFDSLDSTTPTLHQFSCHTKSTPTTPTLHFFSISTSSSSSSSSSSDEIGINKKPPCSPLEEQILGKMKSSEVTDQEKGLLLLRTRTRENKEERILLCTQNVLSALRPFLISRLPMFQSNAVASVINLSLEPANKLPIVRSGAVPALVSALKSVVPEIRSHAAAAVFSLAVEESSKTAIGALGALPPLLGLISKSDKQEDVGTRRDAALALYHLSTSCSTNRSKLARMGAAKILLGIMDSDRKWGKLGGVILMVVGNLAGCSEGRVALMDAGTIEVVVEMIRKINSSARDSGGNSHHQTPAARERIEQCVTVLYGLSKGSLRFRGLAKSAGAEEVLMDLVTEEDVLVGDDDNKGGDVSGVREMAGKMLKAMRQESNAGRGTYGLIDDDNDARSTTSDPTVSSRRGWRTRFSNTEMVVGEANAGGKSLDCNDQNIDGDIDVGTARGAVSFPAVASDRRSRRGHPVPGSGVNSSEF